ncbi:MAG TPA: phosphate acyltransferase [Longimicrobiales bacterium]
MMPRTLLQLRTLAASCGPARVAIAGADSASALEAAHEAVRAGLAIAIPIRAGTEEEVCAAAARMAADEACDIILKGSVRSDQLLRAILDRKYGLRTGRLLSDVLIYEDTLGGEIRLVGVTDGGVNVQPNSDALYQIVQNAVDVFHSLGFERPRVALLSATEMVNDAVPTTMLARNVANACQSLDCEVAGPLALDNALLGSAARLKGIVGDVAGHADILVAPNIEAGNILGKAVKYFGGSSCAHVVAGARVPVLIPSRAENVEDKLNSIALGVIATAYCRR